MIDPPGTLSLATPQTRMREQSGRLEDLIDRSASADAGAFGCLYDEVASRVFALILRVINDRALAEEILQDVFLEIWTKSGSFDPVRGAAMSWILTIAHRRAVDGVRRRRASVDRDYKAGFRDLVHPGDEVADEVGMRDDARRLHLALATLTDKQRRFLHLAYIEGHSQSQIAALTDTPLGTVKTTTRDALTRLRGALT